jgi:hypothetical protein
LRPRSSPCRPGIRRPGSRPAPIFVNVDVRHVLFRSLVPSIRAGLRAAPRATRVVATSSPEFSRTWPARTNVHPGD